MMLKYNLGTKYTTNANMAMMRGIRNSFPLFIQLTFCIFHQNKYSHFNKHTHTYIHEHHHRANLEHKSTHSLIKYMLCVVLCGLSAAPKTNSSSQSPARETEGTEDCQYTHTYIKHSRAVCAQNRQSQERSRHKVIYD